MKKIKFIALGEFAKYSKDSFLPEPAKKNFPSWYKKLPKFTFGQKKLQLSKNDNLSNLTAKSCVPFQDAMSAGYIWKLPADLEISNDQGLYNVRWQDVLTIETHTDEQVINFPIIEKTGNIQIFKLLSNFRTVTPNGWSLLYTQPFNRHDLVLRCFSGVVDTDKFPLEVNFPFQINCDLKENESLIVKKGTPIIQLIPIKRARWFHVKTYQKDLKEYAFILKSHLSDFYGSYRNKNWVKKQYD